MRLKFRDAWVRLSGTFVLFIGSCTTASITLAARSSQNPDSMLPEQNVAKARQLLGQLVDALGGPAYLEARERECDGRRAQFGHNGELTGFIDFKDYWRYPDKHRIDYSKKRNVIDMFNGDEGWTMDRGGVSEEPSGAVSDFQVLVKYGIDSLLRTRLKDPSLNISYAGVGIVDMRQIDWVEVTEPERTLRLAIDRSSHLLLRSVVITINQEMRERTEETTIYTNYQRKGGVMVALQISRERDGKRFYQAFYDNCTFDSHLPEDMFTKAALQKRYAEVGSKKDKDRYKNAKD